MKNKMKFAITSFVMMFAILFSGRLTAQTNTDDTKQTVDIKTSAICGTCKGTIEKAVLEVPGVKSACVDLDTKIVTVVFNSEKTSLEEIKKAITQSGYSADDMPADSAAYEGLHPCCKATE